MPSHDVREEKMSEFGMWNSQHNKSLANERAYERAMGIYNIMSDGVTLP